eukprot:GHVP01054046.1.p1 GENE.GHVP01054046.1~~GHVP01054046.1.p1  ORF type:complete len:770 (-),score=120.23 GHVP01054046.1:45-2354(-)
MDEVKVNWCNSERTLTATRLDNEGPNFKLRFSIEEVEFLVFSPIAFEEENPSVAFNSTFINSTYQFGIPSHATPLNLPEFQEPYRLFNGDIFKYKLNEPTGLYGSVPLLISVHWTPSGSIFYSAIFYLNAADQFFRISRTQENTTVSWVAEFGPLDIFVLTANTLDNILHKYHLLTGLPSMAPVHSIGKQQSRWNYVDESDVRKVSEYFYEAEIPFENIWLDIEHTPARKYFMWNVKKFADPEKMTKELHAKKRGLVLITDPHLKDEESYFAAKKIRDANLAVRKIDGTPYVAACWPGKSIWPDFLDKEARVVWQSFYSSKEFTASDDIAGIWIDMNEPSVFDGEDTTMDKNALHLKGTIPHGHVHNAYGFYSTWATYDALKSKSPRRPFVLSRSFFAGSHRFGAVWTGDNEAKWDHLMASVPMCLSYAMGGMSFVGADVGGFFGNPSSSLLQKWHQLGSWMPFYREHSHIESERREIEMKKSPSVAMAVKLAGMERLRFMPYWISLFLEYHTKGTPIIKPLFAMTSTRVEFDTLRNSTEFSFFVGSNIIVAALPVDETWQFENKNEDLVLPCKESQFSTSWFEIHKQQVYDCGVPINLRNELQSESYLPVFARCGSVILTKDIPRVSTRSQKYDFYSINIFLCGASNMASFKARHFLYSDGDQTEDLFTGNFIKVAVDVQGYATGIKVQASQQDVVVKNEVYRSNDNYINDYLSQRHSTIFNTVKLYSPPVIKTVNGLPTRDPNIVKVKLPRHLGIVWAQNFEFKSDE